MRRKVNCAISASFRTAACRDSVGAFRDMAQDGMLKTRLETWKEVAGFFRRDERTVKRWEATRGLPIHRFPGGGKSRIYAEVHELEAWRRGKRPGLEPVLTRLVAGLRRPLAVSPLILSLALGLLAVGAVVIWRLAPPPSRPPLAAEQLYVLGMEDWRRRTPDAMARAVGELQGAIARYPNYAEAYAGLAQCYDLIREYTQMPGSQAFPLARAAARHALRINPRLADAQAALAFADYYGRWDAERAQREFERAIALDPKSETAHHWYATFLMERGDSAGAAREISRALAVNPTSEAIQADHWDVLYHAGRTGEALAGLRAMEASDPSFLSPHNYLAGFALWEGHGADFVAEAQRAALITGDRNRLALVEAAQRGLAASGQPGLMKALLAEQLQQYEHGLISAFSVAETYALLGDQAAAGSYLKTSLQRHEAEATYINGDRAFLRLHGTPFFSRLASQLRPS